MPRGEFSARLFSPNGSTGTNVSEGAPTATGATGADAVRREGCGPESRMPSFGGLEGAQMARMGLSSIQILKKAK